MMSPQMYVQTYRWGSKCSQQNYKQSCPVLFLDGRGAPYVTLFEMWNKTAAAFSCFNGVPRLVPGQRDIRLKVYLLC